MMITVAARRIISARWNGRMAPFIARIAAGATIAFAPLVANGQALPGAELVEYPSINPDGSMQTLVAHAFTPPPQAAGTRLPAIVILHGSDGITDAREGQWGRELAALGMVALAVDSFGPRKVASTVEDQTRITTGQMVGDAFGSFAFLSLQSFIDPARVAVMGNSKGGGAVLLLADRRPSQSAGMSFAAHVALYPFCSNQYRLPQPAAAVLILIGDADDYSGVKSCADYAERIRKAGGQVELRTYKGAPHGFDGGGAVTRIAAAQNFRDCVMLLEDDGRTVLEKTGEVLDTPQNAIAALKRSCMRTGATAGAHTAARQQAVDDVKAFLKNHILK